MDEIRTFNTVIPETASSLTLPYGYGFNPLTMLLHFDSLPVADSSGRNHIITMNGTSTIDYTQSMWGAAAKFDGSAGCNMRADGGDSFSFVFSNFSIDFWMRAGSITGPQGIIDGYWTNGSWLFYSVDNSFYFYTNHITQASITIAADTWYHVAVSRENLVSRVFLDGVQFGEFPDPQEYFGQGLGGGFPCFGSEDNGAGVQVDFFTGWIDEFRALKGVALYTKDFTPPTRPYNSTPPY